MQETATASFSDVRPRLGATSTLLTQYLQAADVEPPLSLATALSYGIKTITMGLSRDTSPADAAAYSYLQLRIDVEALAKIEHTQVPADYFGSFDATLRAARMYDGLIIAYIAVLSYPDLAAEMADVLLRLEKAQWVICMGVYQGALILSVRTRSQEHTTEKPVQAIVVGEGSAGGHGTIAGGQIPLGDRCAEQEVLLLSQPRIAASGNPAGGRRRAAHLMRGGQDEPKPSDRTSDLDSRRLTGARAIGAEICICSRGGTVVECWLARQRHFRDMAQGAVGSADLYEWARR